MRFMNFSLNNQRLGPTKCEGDVGTAELSYLFRGPFAAGKAFCSSMLDSLLYQSFVKPYLPNLLRLLLGLQFEPGSGFMGTVTVTEKEASLRYFQMFQILTQFTGEIPLGIYRTDSDTDMDSNAHKVTIDGTSNGKRQSSLLSFRKKKSSEEEKNKKHRNVNTERDELNSLIEQRTKYLQIPSEKMEEATYRQGRQSARNGTSYV